MNLYGTLILLILATIAIVQAEQKAPPEKELSTDKEKSPEKAAEKTPEKHDEKTAAKAAEKTAEKTTEKTAEKATPCTTDKKDGTCSKKHQAAAATDAKDANMTMIVNKPIVDITNRCIDTKPCCPHWELVGECKRNPKWMKATCPRSCKVCKPKAGEECINYYEKCDQWSKEDECKKNNEWMEENCAKSCGVCDRTKEDIKKLCGGLAANAKTKECKDYYPECKQWEKDGDCLNNAWWMHSNCPIACKKCTPGGTAQNASKKAK